MHERRHFALPRFQRFSPTLDMDVIEERQTEENRISQVSENKLKQLGLSPLNLDDRIKKVMHHNDLRRNTIRKPMLPQVSEDEEWRETELSQSERSIPHHKVIREYSSSESEHKMPQGYQRL